MRKEVGNVVLPTDRGFVFNPIKINFKNEFLIKFSKEVVWACYIYMTLIEFETLLRD